MAAAAKHTQGPWEYRELEWNRPEDKGDAPGSIVSDDGWFIATVEQMCNHTEGNARLLAAAPELLEALQGLVRFTDAVRVQVGMGRTQLERLAKARAAIAKATEGNT